MRNRVKSISKTLAKGLFAYLLAVCVVTQAAAQLSTRLGAVDSVYDGVSTFFAGFQINNGGQYSNDYWYLKYNRIDGIELDYEWRSKPHRLVRRAVFPNRNRSKYQSKPKSRNLAQSALNVLIHTRPGRKFLSLTTNNMLFFQGEDEQEGNPNEPDLRDMAVNIHDHILETSSGNASTVTLRYALARYTSPTDCLKH